MPDLINGTFECVGAFFIALSILALHRAKVVRGVSWIHAAFFSAWGFWNLYYYPSLGQWASFWGGVGVVTANTVWLGQMIYYLRREKAAPKHPSLDELRQYPGLVSPVEPRDFSETLAAFRQEVLERGPGESPYPGCLLDMLELLEKVEAEARGART